MKKVYLSLNRYLWAKNDDTGYGAGAGGVGGDAGAADGAPDAGAGTGTPDGQAATGTEIDWKASIPAELVDNPRFKDVKSLDDMVKAYAAIKEAPVVPEAMTLPEGIPPELGAWAVESGLTQEQFDSTLAKYGEIETARLEGVKVANKAGEVELLKAWGENSSANLQLANRVLDFADPDGSLKLGEFLKSPESGYAYNNPRIMTLFYNIGKAMKEGGALKSATPPKNPQGKKVNLAHELYPEQAPKV